MYKVKVRFIFCSHDFGNIADRFMLPSAQSGTKLPLPCLECLANIRRVTVVIEREWVDGAVRINGSVGCIKSG